MKTTPRLTLSADIGQANSFGCDEAQSLVDVGDLVDSHLSSLGLFQLVARDDLQESQETSAIIEVLLDFADLHANLSQVRVHPGSEGL